MRRIDHLDEPDTQLGGPQKVAFFRPQRLGGQDDVAVLQRRNDPAKHIRRISIAWSCVTPGSGFRCLGEPSTSTLPPRSQHSRASSPKYSPVRRRTSASGLVR